jgi:hypothetical protein
VARRKVEPAEPPPSSLASPRTEGEPPKETERVDRTALPAASPAAPPRPEKEPEEGEEFAALEEILADIEVEAPLDPEVKRTLIEELRGASPQPGATRAPTPVATAPRGAEPQFRLEGISISEGKSVAIINGVRVREGDSVGGARVASITEGAVRLELDGRTITLRF